MPFIEMFEKFVRESDTSSWRKINGNRQEMLSLCIKSGIPFEVDAFTVLYNKYKGGFWLSSDPSCWYAHAISSGNSSAIKAWETHFKVAPYLLMGKRLAPGTDFVWNGHLVRVTSITADRIIACGQQGTAERRYQITHEEIAARNKSIRDFIKERSATWHERLAALREKETSEVGLIPHQAVAYYVEGVITKSLPVNDMFKVSYCIQGGFTVRDFNKNFATEEIISEAVDRWFSDRVGIVARLAQEHTAKLVQQRLAHANRHIQLLAA